MDNPKRTYYENGNIQIEHWYKNNKNHRLNGPAVIFYYDSGNIEIELWIVNDQPYRLDGPAEIWYDENGKIEIEYWWIDGNKIEQPYDNYPLTTEQVIEMKLKYA